VKDQRITPQACALCLELRRCWLYLRPLPFAGEGICERSTNSIG
jgi:hypothetical protein